MTRTQAEGGSLFFSKVFAQNCLILIFATAVAVAMAMHKLSPAMNGGDGLNK